jgi:ABC-type glycerol-3-phosphate transport system substrate-binding protein
MKTTVLTALLLAATLSSSALAQTGTNSTNNSQSTTNSQSASNSGQTAAAQKIKDDLQKAGFTDIKVVAESFVVQAKTKEGNPIIMTIGPNGMSVFEAMNMTTSGSGGTTSSQGTTGSSSSNSSAASK